MFLAAGEQLVWSIMVAGWEGLQDCAVWAPATNLQSLVRVQLNRNGAAFVFEVVISGGPCVRFPWHWKVDLRPSAGDLGRWTGGQLELRMLQIAWPARSLRLAHRQLALLLVGGVSGERGADDKGRSMFMLAGVVGGASGSGGGPGDVEQILNSERWRGAVEHFFGCYRACVVVVLCVGEPSCAEPHHWGFRCGPVLYRVRRCSNSPQQTM